MLHREKEVRKKEIGTSRDIGRMSHVPSRDPQQRPDSFYYFTGK